MQMRTLKPRRVGVREKNMEAELCICCEARCSCHSCFLIQIFDEDNSIVACCAARAWEAKRFRLPKGYYRIHVSQNAGLDPGGITKWLRIDSERRYSMCFLFSRQMCTEITVPVCFTISDANYPGITTMNGEIHVWRHPITP